MNDIKKRVLTKMFVNCINQLDLINARCWCLICQETILEDESAGKMHLQRQSLISEQIEDTVVNWLNPPGGFEY